MTMFSKWPYDCMFHDYIYSLQLYCNLKVSSLRYKNDILHRRFCIVFSFFMFITEIPMCKMLFFVKWKTYRYALCLSCQTINVKYFSVKHFFFCETRKLPNFFTPTFMKIVSTKLSLHSIVVSMSRNSLL